MEKRRLILSCVDELYPPTCAQWSSLGMKEMLMNFVSNAIRHCTVPEDLRVQKVWPGDQQLFTGTVHLFSFPFASTFCEISLRIRRK
jgi:signal transduction histidine kinase